MSEQEIDEIIDRALRDEARLPGGLGERIASHIDELAAADCKVASARRKWWHGRFAMAASLLLAVAMGLGLYFSYGGNEPKDTFDDPVEAELAAGRALALVSQNLNKGFDEMRQAGQEITKVNEVLNKRLNY